MDLLTPATSADEAQRAAKVAVLPVGSFEQHGAHLPLVTDTVVAAAIARRLATDYELFLLPPITIACSHEHARFAGTVSISATTLQAIVTDVVTSLEFSGVHKLVIVNGHGGNYVLSNVAQSANVGGRRVLLYPSPSDWAAARLDSGCEHDNHRDMHAGEAETSMLLHVAPALVRDGWQDSDHFADERPDFLLLGTDAYTSTGVIGGPSAADGQKGKRLLDALSTRFALPLEKLTSPLR